MNVRNLFTVNAILVFLIALFSTFFARTFLEANGAEVTPYTLNLQRIYGAAIVGPGIASWLMRNAPPSIARKAFLIGGGVGYVAAAVVLAFNILSLESLEGANAYLYIALSLALAAAFLYLGLKEPVGE